ncbi:MAG: ribonuclease R [Candidatus Kapabacteria bacterium]|nr:ribonuclease R [Candidatus Kapabacteria bacterium]
MALVYSFTASAYCPPLNAFSPLPNHSLACCAKARQTRPTSRPMAVVVIFMVRFYGIWAYHRTADTSAYCVMKRMTEIRDLRSDVLEALGKAMVPLQLLDLSKQLRVRAGSEDYEHLRSLLEQMAQEGAITRMSRRRYGLPHRAEGTLQGVFAMHHDNGMVRTDDPAVPVVHVRRHDMDTALDGDTVCVRLHAQAPGRKPRGEIVEIISRAEHVITGSLDIDGSFAYLIPDDARYHVDFLVSEVNLKGARPGDKVVGTLARWTHDHAAPEAVITEVIGTSGSAAVEFAAILKEFRLPTSFPPEVEAEAHQHDEPSGDPPKGRTDLRDVTIITIDPEDARDFDDALSLTVLDNGNVELGVHIADVSHYVPEGSALDKQALERGNSTYLVDCVVPMLPEHLSNNICSLVPDRPRNAFSVFMEFTPAGERTKYRIEETLIRSTRRFTYDEAQRIILGEPGDHEDLLRQLRQLAEVLFARRVNAGGIDFETEEVKFLLDESKMPTRAVIKRRTESTSLVEECMLAANRCVAEHMHQLRKKWKLRDLPPYLYRVHDKPDAEKISNAVGIIRTLGFDVPSGQLAPSNINAILRQAQGKVEQPVVNTLLLRSMAKAVYADYNIGHFGLGFDDYAHFTSPIRRYPDLVVHRLLKEYAKGQPDARRLRQLENIVSYAGDQCSATERSSIEAERASVKLAQTILAREHVGSDHVGYVTGVATFGVFITIKDLMIEGLLHIRDIDDDYYVFDEQRMRIYGRRTRRVFRYGSLVRVRIAKANTEKRMIDLVMSADQQDLIETLEAVEVTRTELRNRGARRRSKES